MNPGKLLVRVFWQSAIWLAFMAVLLFWPAGDWRWGEGWTFLAIFAAGSALMCAWLIRRDPALLAERMASPVQKEQAPWDRVFMIGTIIVWCGWLAFMGFDAGRLHRGQMPMWLEAVGGFLIVIGFGAIMPVFAANSYAAPVVRVQSERRQHVIDTGPYAIVRHPMYAAASLYVFGIPLLLGSRWGLIGSVLIMAAIAFRATKEEQTLKDGLAGYADYMTRVRYRLVPYVW
jgi:protein-S-isoprenylcysteine O-methyltransferase Ste14